MESRFGRKYGWRPDTPDHRDLHHAPPARLAMSLPGHIDQRPMNPPIKDQGALGSCTANMGVRMAEYLILNNMHDKSPEPWAPLSRRGLYYDERVLDGTVPYDAGSQIRTCLKAIAKKGVGLESLCPYDIDKFTEKPSPEYYVDAEKRQGLVYARVQQTACAMKGVLAQGLPIGIGFTVYESFESDYTSRTGIVSMPRQGESVLGGHAVVIVGYDDEKAVAPIDDCFIVANSWGVNWGDNGYCYFPQSFLLNPDLADDFWVLQSIE